MSMPMLFGAIVLSPGGVISWLVVGLISGFLAGQFMKGGGYGVIGDIVVGLIGAFLGGLVVGFFTNDAGTGFWGSIVVSFIGACLFIALSRAIFGGRRAV